MQRIPSDLDSDKLQGAISYGLGSSGIILPTLVEVSHYAEVIGVILGCLVIAIRAVHDLHKYIRFLKHKK